MTYHVRSVPPAGDCPKVGHNNAWRFFAFRQALLRVGLSHFLQCHYLSQLDKDKLRHTTRYYVAYNLHSGTSSSISDSPIPSHITSYSSDSPPCSSITPSLFHSRFKTYPCHKSYPRSSTSSPRTAFTDYCLDRFFWATRFLFLSFPLILSFLYRAPDQAGYLVSFWVYRITLQQYNLPKLIQTGIKTRCRPNGT